MLRAVKEDFAMATFVLVHGAWTGAFGFRHVRRMLQAQGHEVFTPSLTGVGDRAHLASPQVGLGTHVRDVVNLVLYENLRDFVLLGFSYGGFVVSGALEHIGDRVKHLVLLDAFMPEKSGDTVSGLIRGATERAPIAINEAWLLPPKERHFDLPEEGAFVAARRTPQPAATFTEPVYLARPLEDYPFRRTYIRASVAEPDPVLGALARSATRALASPAWTYREIATTHMVASNRPGELAAMLGEIAGA
jgi:pimeloyl-ACP methyl ester carboxylesterase